MSDLGALERRALLACEARHHNMSFFTSFSDTQAGSFCQTCGMEVHVKTNPMPNEIDIGGEAVALNCPGKVRREPTTRRDIMESQQRLRDRLWGG